MTYLISGYKRTGKDTLIDSLLKGEVDNLGWKVYSSQGIHNKPSQVLIPGGIKTSFAKKLKEIFCDMFNIYDISLVDKIKDMNVEEAENIIQRKGVLNGKTVRAWLIEIADDYKARYGKTYFSDIVYSKNQEILYVCDFRFPEEYRPGAITIRLFRSSVPLALDASERALDNFRCDYLFCPNHNDFTIACNLFPQYRTFLCGKK